ncbi:MAG: hypothetical protein OSB21_14180, partial [Myxococcota bacterium]|nr:hypothetical protein [Myxococcota bacterium]
LVGRTSPTSVGGEGGAECAGLNGSDEGSDDRYDKEFTADCSETAHHTEQSKDAPLEGCPL